MKLYIKNMACECCKVLVKETLEKSGIEVKEVQLGEAEIKDKLTDEQRKTVNQELQRAGLEIIENKNSLLLEKIKKNILIMCIIPLKNRR